MFLPYPTSKQTSSWYDLKHVRKGQYFSLKFYNTWNNASLDTFLISPENRWKLIWNLMFCIFYTKKWFNFVHVTWNFSEITLHFALTFVITNSLKSTAVNKNLTEWECICLWLPVIFWDKTVILSFKKPLKHLGLQSKIYIIYQTSSIFFVQAQPNFNFKCF